MMVWMGMEAIRRLRGVGDVCRWRHRLPWLLSGSSSDETLPIYSPTPLDDAVKSSERGEVNCP